MQTILPHGGTLINRLVNQAEAADNASVKKVITIDEWTLSDLDCLAIGAFSPLTGFMNEADYRSVVETMRLADGTVWPLL